MARAYLDVLLVTMLRMHDHRTVIADDRGSSVVDRFRRLVAEHADAQSTVAGYAAELGITPAHLADVVRAATGQPPGAHLRSAVALEAKRLLALTDLTANQISHRLQFADPSYFSRFFRRESGRSPSAFRREIREKYQLREEQ